ncbi:MAG: hypothetical protein Q4G07_06815 [Oscillospiraceae bacterium]|nr:hypothetical protein [Oscillospiraceae bacterium]
MKKTDRTYDGKARRIFETHPPGRCIREYKNNAGNGQKNACRNAPPCLSPA